MRKMTMRDAMTATPHTIGRTQPLSVAREMMHKHSIRHLPVLEGGQLVGLVSARDLEVLDGVQGVDAGKVTVEEAMAQDVYLASPDAPLAHSLEAMASHKYGCIVVADQGKVVGIFSTVDAVRLLAGVLNKT